MSISFLVIKMMVYFTGKGISSVPHRNKSSKWYVSREVWAPDLYPVWFQGLVYFLTPQHAGELFQTALDTHYMHTDDVFVGIIVDKTSSIAPFTNKLRYISEFAATTKQLTTKWLSSPSKFYHVPDLGLYYIWAVENLEKYRDSLPRISS